MIKFSQSVDSLFLVNHDFTWFVICDHFISEFECRVGPKEEDQMARHRGKFDPENLEPYELSRSRIENFIKCPACFYLQQVEKIKFPSIPGFNINEATDILLKRDFDEYRGANRTHPYLEELGLGHLIPFQHENFELWTQSLHFGAEGRFNTVHE